MLNKRMFNQQPDFWNHSKTPITNILSPLSYIYQAITLLRWKIITPYKASVPVICIGNATMGGGGKTPCAIMLAQLLKKLGKNPYIISRGYKSNLRGNILVNSHHSAKDVGDEPLLLSQAAPCIIGKNRRKSAQMSIALGADIIIMDDGLQNPSLYKDFSLLMIDGGYGFGNNHIFPAGSLRENLTNVFSKVNAIILIGKDEKNIINQLPRSLPLLRAQMQLEKHEAQKVVAFCGIARPSKFYASLTEHGFEIAQTHDFPDHHYFSNSELEELCQSAIKNEAQLVTTQKDWVRLPPDWQDKIRSINAKLELAQHAILMDLLLKYQLVKMD